MYLNSSYDNDSIKLIVKGYDIVTIRVGAVDGSDKYDEFTFNVSEDFKELSKDISVIVGEAEIIIGSGSKFEVPEVKATDNLDENIIVNKVIKIVEIKK